MTIELTKEELEFLNAIFNSSVQIPASHIEIAAGIKAKLNFPNASNRND